jgi:NarL family two-component system response regulator LiaR
MGKVGGETMNMPFFFGLGSDGYIRVLVVDDHAATRRALKFCILAFDDLRWVGEANNGEAALRLCADLQPEVVLMDLVMPGMGGVRAIRAMHEGFPRIQVIALTSFGEEGLVEEALEAGARSFLLKNVSAKELAAAIRAAHAGRPTLAGETTRN